MKKLLTTLCLVFLVSCSNEVPSDKLVQREGITYEVNSDTPFTGTLVEFYENGQLERKVDYKNGKQTGSSEKFFENGQLWLKFGVDFFESYHKNGQLKEIRKESGLFEEYHENGQLKLRGKNKKNQIPDGIWERYDRNGVDISNGPYRVDYSNGRYIRNYKDGKLNGESTFFYPNDKIESRTNYKNNLEHGLSESFTKYGILTSRVNYKNGIREGTYEIFDNNGELEEKGNYRNGKKDGVWESFYRDKGRSLSGDRYNKLIRIEEKYKDGEPVGPSRTYENGKLIRTDPYRD